VQEWLKYNVKEFYDYVFLFLLQDNSIVAKYFIQVFSLNIISTFTCITT